jgi:hypothetical protein
VLDVLGDPGARLLGQLTIPAGQQRAERPAVLPLGARDEQRPQVLLQLAAGAGRQGVRLAPRHAERGRQVAVIKVMTEAQLDDLALIRIQLAQNGVDQFLQFGLLWVDYLGGLGGGLGSMIRASVMIRRASVFGRRRRIRAEPAQAFAAGHRVQPRAQLGGLGQVAQRGGNDERFPHGFGGIRWLVQHPVAVAVEAGRIPVVRHGDTRRVPGRDRRDNLAVIHGHTVVHLLAAAQSEVFSRARRGRVTGCRAGPAPARSPRTGP